ncbi:non-ribosomal peptide synthetase [Vibrio sp. MEBiC08052]|uniref:non-ribosomal peptide synthetase n=1 Tax=Vibrio sp. MEBiC08052 TaxID=1761910 RepID=UPI0007406141|nr:non-ribosomal peptide synthetase [Vibrio sp. MEBiC08052]KUI98279.1 hypothetical protein VRK_29800 [Vibrio sp. MEBiC08052]
MNSSFQERMMLSIRKHRFVLDEAIFYENELSSDNIIRIYVVLDNGHSTLVCREKILSDLYCIDGFKNTMWDIYFVSNIPVVDGIVDFDKLLSQSILANEIPDIESSNILPSSEIADIRFVLKEHVNPSRRVHLSDIFLHQYLSNDYDNIQIDSAEYTDSDSSEYYKNIVRERPKAISCGGDLPEFNHSARTMSEALLTTAKMYPNRAITCIDESGQVVRLTYQMLLAEAQKVLAGLSSSGIKSGDIVILQIKKLDTYFPVLWGCILAGVHPITVAVPPVYHPDQNIVKKLFNIWSLLDKPVVITTPDYYTEVAELSLVMAMEGLRVFSSDNLIKNGSSDVYAERTPRDIVFLQLSSGSTGISKCIPETSRSIISHAQGEQIYNGVCDKNITLNWLPMDHVVPLLTCHLKDVYLGCEQLHVDTGYILSDPLRWLDLIDTYRVTHTWAPNFGFRLVSEQLSEGTSKHWDLSSIQYFMNAGEQATLSVIKAFIDAVTPFGVKPHSMQPAFGMAESSTCITYQNNFDVDTGIYQVQPDKLFPHILHSYSGSGEEHFSFVSLGKPVPGVEIRIADENNETLPEGVIGNLHIRGAVVTSGYIRNDVANTEALVGDGWFNSGDLGFIKDKNLVLTGRKKEQVIVNGANYYCYDIEDIVSSVSGVLSGYVASFGARNAQTETHSLIICFVLSDESVLDDFSILCPIIDEIRSCLARQIGLSPEFIIPMAKDHFPRTTSGKIQRTMICNQFIQGKFDLLLKEIDLYSNNANTIPDYFFSQTWSVRNDCSVISDSDTQPVVVFADTYGLGDELSYQLRKSGIVSIIVEPGDQYNMVSEEHYTLDPQDPCQIESLFHTLRQKNQFPSSVICLWNYRLNNIVDEHLNFSGNLQTIFHLLSLANILGKVTGEDEQIHLMVVGSQMYSVLSGDTVDWRLGALPGYLRTLPQENPCISCRYVDLEPRSSLERIDATVLAQELRIISSATEVAYRHGKRWVPQLSKVLFPQQETELFSSPFQQHGCYVLTGGLGGIGFLVARHLLQHYQAHLLLIGRDLTSDKSEKLKMLQSLQGDVLYESADVCNLEAIRAAVEKTESRWGQSLNGAIHLAGHYSERKIANEKIESALLNMAPKVQGAWVLHQILSARENTFCLYMSSVIGLFGGVDVGTYAAANAFLGSFTQYQNSCTSVRAYCFDWSMWNNVGMNTGYKFKDLFLAKGYFLIPPRQALFAMEAALQTGPGRIVIGLDKENRNISARLDQYPVSSESWYGYYVLRDQDVPLPDKLIKQYKTDYGIAGFIELDEFPLTDSKEIDYRALALYREEQKEYVKPANDLEFKIAEIWQKILQIEDVSVCSTFFELGGNSLLAMKLIERLSAFTGHPLMLNQLFDYPTIREFSEWIATLEIQENLYESMLLSGAEQDRYKAFPLTDMQQAYFVGRQNVFSLGGVSLHWYVEIECSSLDVSRFNQACNSVIRRHEALRTVIVEDDQQCVLEHVPTWEIPIVDYSHLQDVQVDKCLSEIREEMSHQIIDLKKWPMFDVRLSVLSPEKQRLHISIDGQFLDTRSFQIILHDLLVQYQQPADNDVLEPFAFSFRDYVQWQENRRQVQGQQQSLNYWREKIKTLAPAPDLPLAKQPNQLTQHQTRILHRNLAVDLLNSIESQSQEYGLTSAAVWLTAYTTILERWSHSPRFTINVPVLNRPSVHDQIHDVAGLFSTFVPVEVDYSTEMTFVEKVKDIQYRLAEAMAHTDVSGVEILREIFQQQSHISDNLMPVVFTCFPTGLSSWDKTLSKRMKSVLGEPVYVANQTPQVWLDYLVTQEEDCVHVSWVVTDGLFPEGMIEDMFDAHYQLLCQLGTMSEAWHWLPQSSCRLPEKQMAVRQQSNNTATSFPTHMLHELFDGQAESQPESIALIGGGKRFSYQEVFHLSNHIGHLLRLHGIQPNQLVAVVMKKGWEQIVAILGILKSGGAYLPIDASLPEERQHYLLENADVSIVLTQEEFEYSLRWPESVRVVRINDDMKSDASGSDKLPVVQSWNDLAYVIFTSGSTGQPKGVMIDHLGVTNTVLDINQRYRVTNNDRTLAISSLSFDLSVYDVFGVLAAGGTVIVPDADKLRDPEHWFDLIERERVSVWNTVPALMQMLVDYAEECHGRLPESLRIVLMSGDWIPVSLPERIWTLGQKIEVNSLGGATEASIWSIHYPIRNVDPQWKSIPYGQPLLNQTYHVLDHHLAEKPDFVTGDLYIGGIGLARGYWKNQEKSRESFILHPDTKERLYRTGDRGCYLPDGNILFQGREDYQVKIQGYRIELGEIESVLKECESAQDAVVIVIEPRKGSRQLAAIVQKEGGKELTSQIISEVLEKKLPEYMVPSAIVVVSKMPLTSNGKVDRNALEKLACEAYEQRQNSQSSVPVSDLEATLASGLQDILSVPSVDLESSFFSLGATSVDVVAFYRKLKQSLSCELSTSDLFKYTSIRKLADFIVSKDSKNLDLSVAKSRASKARQSSTNARSRRKSRLENYEL